MHRKIELENILIERESGDINIKLCDFGLACQFDKEGRGNTGIIGSLNYLAPEMIKRESYGCKVDVWSASVVIFSLITGNLPFYSQVKRDLTDQILNKDLDLILSAFDLSEEARSFLVAGLERDQHKRPSCKELLAHEWLNQDEKSNDALDLSFSTASTKESDLNSSLSQDEMETAFINVNHVLKKAVCQLLAGQAVDKKKIVLILRGLIKFISKRTADRRRARAEARQLQSL